MASDGFESGTTSGGTGWNGNWTFNGSYTSIITSSSPPEGSRQLLMRSWTSMATRTVVVPSGGATLKFCSKVYSFESNDSARLLVNGNTVLTFTSASATNCNWQASLPAGLVTITFEADMSASSDYWYIDGLVVTKN